MYTIKDNQTIQMRIVEKDKQETKIFIVNDEIVEFPENGIVCFPLGTEIQVYKLLHWVRQQIEISINKSVLHHNAVMVRYGIGQVIEVSETEKLRASLELVEKY